MRSPPKSLWSSVARLMIVCWPEVGRLLANTLPTVLPRKLLPLRVTSPFLPVPRRETLLPFRVFLRRLLYYLWGSLKLIGPAVSEEAVWARELQCWWLTMAYNTSVVFTVKKWSGFSSWVVMALMSHSCKLFICYHGSKSLKGDW